jgi:hypothetical protein
MARIRSRQVETQSVNQRMVRRGAVHRFALDRWSVGKEQIRPGSVDSDTLGKQAVREVNIVPELIPREIEVLDHGPGPVTVSESHDMPCRRGGRASIVLQVKEGFAPTGDITVDVFHNGTVFATAVLPDGETQSFTPYNKIFYPLDRMRAGVTDAAAGAEGLVVVWWFE